MNNSKKQNKANIVKRQYIWKLYNVKRGVGIGCLMPVCDGLDNLEHVQQCKFYYTKWNPAWVNDDDSVEKYLVKLNRKRTKRFKMPII